jgi:hypothetical protein
MASDDMSLRCATRVDAGTSLLLLAHAHPDFHAETAFETIVQFLRLYGLPEMLTLDRDVRWVGSATQRDFPSALVQFLYCLGVFPNILPPRHRRRSIVMSNGIIGPINKSVSRSFVPAPLKKCAPSLRSSNSTTIKSALTKDAVVATNRLRWLIPSCRRVRHCRTPSTRIAGLRRSMVGGIPAMSSLMAESWSMVWPITSSRRWLDVRFCCVSTPRLAALMCFRGDQVLKQMPIKGLQGQPMALEAYIALMTERARAARAAAPAQAATLATRGLRGT